VIQHCTSLQLVSVAAADIVAKHGPGTRRTLVKRA
jgi:hypothetical protein